MKNLLKIFCFLIVSSYSLAQCKADAGPDLIIYNGNKKSIGGNPSASSSTPTSFTYKWETDKNNIDIVLDCDSNCSNPFVYSYTKDTVLYQLTIEDETTKCFSTDSVTVISIIDNEDETKKNKIDNNLFVMLQCEISDISPEYPGGSDSMVAFLTRNLIYPDNAIEMEIQGKSYISFVVNKKGEVCNVKVNRGVPGCPECDDEALRVVRLMPNWIPGQKDGKNIKSLYVIPITYKLETNSHKNRRSK